MIDTPLRAAARMLDRLHARACHHDSPRHLLATAYEHVELAATLSPAEAIRVMVAGFGEKWPVLQRGWR